MKRIYTMVTAAALLLIGTSAAQAQKMKPASMPATSKAHMTKGQKDAMKASHDAAKDARKADERAEKAAKDELKDQPKAMLKHVKLSKEEKTAVKAVEKRTDEQLTALEKQEKADEKAGRSTADVAHKIAALRDGERAEIRAALTPEHQTRVDQNVTSMKAKH